MDINKINLKTVFLEIYVIMQQKKLVYPHFDSLKEKLSNSNFYADELASLRLIENSVKTKRGKIERKITKIENRKRYNHNDFTENSNEFKGLPKEKIKHFISNNEFDTGDIYSFEYIIARNFCKNHASIIKI